MIAPADGAAIGIGTKTFHSRGKKRPSLYIETHDGKIKILATFRDDAAEEEFRRVLRNVIAWERIKAKSLLATVGAKDD